MDLKRLTKETEKRLAEGSEESRDKAADFIMLPDAIPGTNCGNCQYFKGNDEEKTKGMCGHEKIDHMVSSRNCCAYWDNPGAERYWKK